MSKSRVILSVATITLLAAAMSASAADTAEGLKSAEADASFQQFIQRGQQQKSLVPSQFTTRGKAECAAAATTCTFGAVGFVLGCGAAVYATFGALSAGCLTAFAGVGTVCSGAAFYCAGGTGTPPTRRLTTVGDFTDDGTGPDVFVERTCGNERFVDQMKIEWFYVTPGANLNARVSRITMRCTPATNGGASTTIAFGHAGGTNSNTYTCSAGRLMAGMLLQAGGELDAAGGVCRLGASSNVTTYVNGIWGGDGGSRADKVCAAGTNLVGAKVNMDGASEATANLLGVELICR